MQSKKRKIAVLGTGNVGATTAYTLMLSGLASEIVLVDINKEKALGEAIDLTQCAATCPSCKVWSGEYADVKGSDIVIVTFGVGRKPGQTRLDLAKINLGILKSVMPDVAKIEPNALYIIVSNPVDVLTYETIKCTGLPAERVIGTGTLLDSNRLSQFIADFCGVDITNVTSYVIGEHGDACMVPWSACSVCGIPLKKYCLEVLKKDPATLDAELEELYANMVKSGSIVIKAKGATFYAISCSVVQLVKALLSDTHTLLPLSTVLHGEYGANDLCMGIPTVVGGLGVEKIVNIPMEESEKAILAEKVASLDATYNALEVRN